MTWWQKNPTSRLAEVVFRLCMGNSKYGYKIMLLRKEYLNFLERKPYISFTADAGYSLTFLLHHVICQRKSKITLELVSERNLKSLIYDCLVAFPDTLGVIAKPPIQVSIPSEIYPSLFINTEINVCFFFFSFSIIP